MAETPEILGFSGRWYPDTVKGAQHRALITGLQVLVPTPEHLLACKLEAWQDRGRADPLLSQDLEDVVSLLDGCRELEARVATAAPDLRAWLASVLHEILDDRVNREAVLAHVPRGGNEAEREERLLTLMGRLADRRRFQLIGL